MKNVKDIVTGLFAIIGVFVLLTGFNNHNEEKTGKWVFHPDAHVSINSETGEVRRYDDDPIREKGACAYYVTYESPVNKRSSEK